MFRLVLTSRCVGLLRRLRRLFGTEPVVDLDSIAEIQTVGDWVDAETLTQWLPVDWCATIELVKFRGESLAEVVRLTHRQDGTRITLKPVATDAPTGPIEIYTRPASTAERTHHSTEASLSTGLTEATRLTALQNPLSGSQRDHRHTDDSQQRGEKTGSEIRFTQ